ncbi:retropepsin-like aspartic protease family protein [Chitinophaga sancti]|uniref:Predicted aspartyl protease n=1 Tax=Chitinophaga sancti TaxID=1004 RepID=A0A1K1SNA3_9BACT|nr:retropepsin-like aspartic protease [Chitinophaga sancti]WQD60079.1 retropepsin-like aspartic protease [Chitinophaga sancti]WQG87793.1 retropepsin-like aspartic protease [Chitinophaga sancti]SFW85700.1 Predicted aspartyl protease [Chitinophaga sancti]
MKYTIRLICLLMTINCVGQTNNPGFNKIYSLIMQKDFFHAKSLYDSSKSGLSSAQQNYLTALLDNAFNQVSLSAQRIASLKGDFSDSLWLELYRIKEDNAAKMYNYKAAKATVQTMLQQYKYLLSPDGQDDLKNSLHMWTTLEHTPPQRVVINGTNKLRIKKDKAGLNNLDAVVGKDTADFIFDTGANMSTISLSTAKRLHMQILPADIVVGAITGASVKAQLGVCKQFKLGNIEVNNAVFLVLADSALAFPQINYKIEGILGYPVISALKEVQLTQDGYLIVPEKETAIHSTPNMAIDRLSPLIFIDGKHYTFDTGADETFLYANFFEANKAEISANYKPVNIRFGGAGGKTQQEAYKIRHHFNIMEKDIVLDSVPVLKDKISNEMVYGNIGQDIIRQFSRMTINFDKMFIKFD